jgi:hypothetical protein
MLLVNIGISLLLAWEAGYYFRFLLATLGKYINEKRQL